MKRVAGGSWRERLRRWRWWLVALALLIVVRVALPEVLRRVVVSQASEALNARVDVGDVDLRLWRGGVALEDVAVREKGAPEPPPVPEQADENAPPPPFDDHSPVVGFKRFAVEVRFLPLFSKTIQLRNIALDAPRVALDRLASGEFNVMALMPQQEVSVEAGATPGITATPTALPEVEEEEGPGWKFGLDEFVLTDGRIRFRDMTLEGSEPIEVGIDRISVNEIALTPAVYGKPGRIAIELGIDEGKVDVTADLALDGSEVGVTTDVTAHRLPLRRARLYVPEVGWSELRGELDLGLTYELRAHEINALHGTLALRDVSVSVPDLEDSAVGWKSLAVDLERIDLLAQRAAVREVALDGAVVAVRVQGSGFLPVLARKAAAAAAKIQTPPVPTPAETAIQTIAPTSTPVSPAVPAPASANPTATSTTNPTAKPSPEVEQSESSATAPPDTTAASPSSAETATEEGSRPASPPAMSPSATPAADEPAPAGSSDEPPAAPWGWQVAAVKIADSKLRILREGAPLDVDVNLTAADFSGDADSIGHVRLDLAIESGTVALDGDVRIAPVPAFGGTLKIVDLSLPALPAVNRVLPPEAFLSGNLRSDLAISAGLPSSEGNDAPADRLHVGGTLGLAALKLSPLQAPGLTVELQDLELRISQLVVPGVIPPGQPAAAGAKIDLAAGLTLNEPRVTRTGEAPLAVSAQSIGLEIPSLTVPAALAGLGPGDGVPLVSGALGLELVDSRVGVGNDDMTVEAQRIELQVTDARLPVLPPAAAPAAEPAETGDVDRIAAQPPAMAPTDAPPTTLALQLDLTKPKVTTAQGRELNVGAESISLALGDVVVPGFVAGAPSAPTLEPLQAKGKLQLGKPRVARGDGKELSISVQSIDVPLQSLALPGVPGGIPSGASPPPLRAAFGDIRLEAPVIRMTRRKEGIVMPVFGTPAGAGPEPAPPPAPTPEAQESPATQALELQIASLRLLRGQLAFVDRAVDPTFSTRFAPIEIDARNIRLPGPQVKPLNVEITSEEQGKITVRADLAPDASTLELEVDELTLHPFNPYATTYSPYSIADGALSIQMKAEARGGKYDVENDIRLHQFDLAGAEEDSRFEKNFGIPLSMALALLRDVHGNINLSVPLEVDRSGKAKVDVMRVVRSALRRAITGAITSPLKILGAAVGGKGAPIAPSPVAFRLGRAEPTKAGQKSAERLAAFLASRPAMGVQLSSAATPEDERWLHEQALLGDWAGENVFERSLAFVTERGPRERIRAYLEARREKKKPEGLSAEDAATLDEWLAERPVPSAEQLQALAETRIAAVEAVLREEGIDPSRVSRGEPPEEATAPTVRIRLGAGPLATDRTRPPTGDEEEPD